MNELDLLVDLHRHNQRQGPGGEPQARLALALAGLDPSATLDVADIGCGTGVASLFLAQALDARVTAIDILPAFLEEVELRAQQAGLGDAISTMNASMSELPLARESLDLAWSEGAVYNMGFAEGVTYWHQFLRPGGSLVVSEITWTTAGRPKPVQAYWESAYPQIDTASRKMGQLEDAGYRPEGYFVLPAECWLENYYLPLEKAAPAFLARHPGSEAAAAIVAEGDEELALYREYGAFYSYGVYVASKV